MGTRSAAKAWRSSEQRRLRNRVHSSAARTFVSSARLAIATADADEAAQAVRLAVSALDRAAQKGVIHPNNASRRKARLLKKYNAALAAAAVAAQEAPPARKRRGKKEEATQVAARLGESTTKEPALSAAKGRRAGKEEAAKKERRAGKEEPAKKERRAKKKEK